MQLHSSLGNSVATEAELGNALAPNVACEQNRTVLCEAYVPMEHRSRMCGGYRTVPVILLALVNHPDGNSEAQHLHQAQARSLDRASVF
jgi:hypothetical protein